LTPVLKNSPAFWVVSWALLFADSPALLASENVEIEFVGTARIPGDARDLSGDAALLENGEPRNRLGGFSALDYSDSQHVFAALSDRGPDDGAVGYPCRVQLFEIAIRPGNAVPVEATNTRTVFFSDSHGLRFTGSSAMIAATNTVSHRFDPEGFRFGPDKSMFVADEYGPVLIQFSTEGKELKRFELPDHLVVANPDADKKKENLANTSGRASNRGMECLAMSSDGTKLVGLMQSALIQDGERTKDGVIHGRNCRLVEIEISTGQLREFVYQMDSVEHGNSEILAYGPEEYLVLERDSLAGKKAGYRKLVHVTLAGATDIAGMKKLPSGNLPQEISPLNRTVFLDFLDPQWKLAGATMPEKIEGLTFGPMLNDGRRSLLVSTDNDFESANDSLIWVFAVKMLSSR
jgi:hypothetical protein